MEKVDSLDESYNKLRKINVVNLVTLIGSIIVSLLGYWFSHATWFIAISVIVIFSYCITSIVCGLFANILGNRRLVNAVEDGFEKEINSDAFTVNYYNNMFPGGIDKFNLDLFESIYFTFHIFNKQAKTIYICAVACMIATIYAIVFTEPALSVLILEIAFGGDALIKTVKTIYFHVTLARIFEDFDKVYVAKEHISHQHFLLSLCIKYERIKAYYGLNLDSVLFNKMNVELSKKWNEYVAKICDSSKI